MATVFWLPLARNLLCLIFYSYGSCKDNSVLRLVPETLAHSLGSSLLQPNVLLERESIKRANPQAVTDRDYQPVTVTSTSPRMDMPATSKVIGNFHSWGLSPLIVDCYGDRTILAIGSLCAHVRTFLSIAATSDRWLTHYRGALVGAAGRGHEASIAWFTS